MYFFTNQPLSFAIHVTGTHSIHSPSHSVVFVPLRGRTAARWRLSRWWARTGWAPERVCPACRRRASASSCNRQQHQEKSRHRAWVTKWDAGLWGRHCRSSPGSHYVFYTLLSEPKIIMHFISTLLQTTAMPKHLLCEFIQQGDVI